MVFEEETQMKKFAVVLAGMMLVTALASKQASAQANPRGEASFQGGKVTIDYGKPSTKGRDVMGMISPGSNWRMGADTATTLKTDVDLTFGDKTVPKGSYTLLAHFVEKEKWNLLITKGSADDAVAEVPGTLEKGQENVEQLTIELQGQANDASLVLRWSTYRLSADFKVN
jgi:hypothetical protein